MYISPALIPLVSAFVIVALAEFGDKSQIGIITLSTKHKSFSIFIGSMLAFLVIDGIVALISGSIAQYLPVMLISMVAGIFFIIFGIYTLVSKEDEKPVETKKTSGSIKTSFLLIAALENGDKTQLAIIALSVKYAAPVQVFIGLMLAFAVLTVLSIAFGRILSRYVSSKYIKIGSGLVFILFGIIFLLSIASGISV